MAVPALELKGVTRKYMQGENQLVILDNADFTLNKGEMVALVAPSGAGKSTLLHTAGLLEHPDSGEVTVNGRASSGLKDEVRTAMRRAEIGFVYQFHHLLPEFSALENIMVPQMLRGLTKAEAAKRAMQLLDYMKIGPRAEHRPAELSGGSSSASRSPAPSPMHHWCCLQMSRRAILIRRPRPMCLRHLRRWCVSRAWRR